MISSSFSKFKNLQRFLFSPRTIHFINIFNFSLLNQSFLSITSSSIKKFNQEYLVVTGLKLRRLDLLLVTIHKMNIVGGIPCSLQGRGEGRGGRGESSSTCHHPHGCAPHRSHPRHRHGAHSKVFLVSPSPPTSSWRRSSPVSPSLSPWHS